MMRPRVQFSPAAPFFTLLSIYCLVGGKPPSDLVICGENPPLQGEWTVCRGTIVALIVANFIYVPQMRHAPTGAASFDLVARGRLATLQTVHLSSQQFRVGALRCGIFHNGYNVMRSHNILVNARGRGIISSQLMGNRCLHVPLSQKILYFGIYSC